MDTPTMTLPLPGLIDGDTDEVEELVIEALFESMDQFAEWIDDVARQLANAERTRILEGEAGMKAEDLMLAYAESSRAATIVRMQGAAKALVSATTELRR